MVFAGSLLHFTYALSGQNAFVGIFSAVNESVWEHSKLFILPLFLVGLIELRLVKDVAKVLWTKLIEFMFMSLFITAFFYTYTGALGVSEVLVVDIASFVIAVVVGQYISFKMLSSKNKAPVDKYISAALLTLIFAAFSYFTFNPPAYPIFESHDTAR